jgi:uncharacterized protein YggT (Ycf19 family)
LGFAAMFYQTRNQTFSQVGINKGSLDWHFKCLKMQEVGSLGFFGDYSNYDSIVPQQIIEAIGRIMNAWYGENATSSHMRTMLFRVLQHPIHHFRNVLYQTTGGVASGDALTIICNTIANEFLLRLAWNSLVPINIRDMHYYRKLTRSAIVGDDNEKTVHPSVAEYYNAATVSAFFQNFGITYADATKDGKLTPLRPYMEGSFLKNNFGKMDTYYVPLMDEDANLETLNWIRKSPKGPTADEACEMNANNVLRNAFFYGRGYFLALRSRILKEKPQYNLLRFSALYDEFHNFGYLADPTGAFSFGRHNEYINPELHRDEVSLLTSAN